MSAPIVVYVDDEPALCRIFSLVLARVGASARTFTDPHEALAFLDANPVAVVVCDYRMPRMTGLELLSRMTRNVPFYLVSGDLNIREQLGDDPRIHGVIDKPFRAEALLETLRAHLPGEA